MKQRYDWTLWNIFIFVNFLIVLLNIDEIQTTSKGDEIITVIISSVVVIVTGSFLIHKFRLWIKK